MDISNFIEFRQLLHRYPELSGAENATRELVRAFITPFSPFTITEIAKTGLLLTYKGKTKSSRKILIRAELDALPITEQNNFTYRSLTDSKSHKCGHDGHMAILCRLAWLLHQHPLESGTAYLLFQPAEENGKGANAVLQDPAFNKAVDKEGDPLQVIALHNVPGYEAGHILLRKGNFTPAVRSIIVKYKGKTSHAAEPENGICSAAAIATFLQAALGMARPDRTSSQFFLVSPIYMHMGEKSYGVTAGDGEIHLTIRGYENNVLDERANRLERLARDTGQQFGLSTHVDWTEQFEANENSTGVVDQIEHASQQLGMVCEYLPSPMKWGEDFGLFTRTFKGAMFGIGAGTNQPALHNPDYDFNDTLIEPASNLFDRIIRNYLNQEVI